MGQIMFFVVGLLCLHYAHTMEWTDSLGTVVTRDDGSKVLQKPSNIQRLAFERARTHMRMANNPFDFTVDWSHDVWPTHVIEELANALRIEHGTVNWLRDVLVYHPTDKRLDSHGNRITLWVDRFHIVLDKKAWVEKPDPIPWGAK